MKLQFKKYIKNLTCLTLVTCLLLSNSATAFAAEPVGSQDVDFDLLADLISERTYLDKELANIGMSLDKIFALPKMDDSFYEEVEALTKDVMPNSVSAYADEPTIQTLEAQRFAYAGKMAQWSVAQKSGRIIEDEVVYMYLSHYVDVPQPLDISNGISNNSENNTLGKYICQYDRDTYDLYLSKGSALQTARDIKNFVSFSYNSYSGVDSAISWAKNMEINVKLLANFGGGGVTATCGAAAFDIIEKGLKGGQTPEQILEDVTVSLDPTYGEASRSIALEILSFVFSTLGESLTTTGTIISLASVYIELSTAILDKANFAAMRSYFSFRWADRFDYWMYGRMS